MLVPYDPTVLLDSGKEVYLNSLLNEGKILHSDGLDAIYYDILENRGNLVFTAAYEEVKDKNILIFAAQKDTVSVNEKMIVPLWNKLSSGKTYAVQRLIEYPVEHGLIGRRISVIRDIAEFISSVI